MPSGPTATCEPWTAPSCASRLIRSGADQVCPWSVLREKTIRSEVNPNSELPMKRDHYAYTLPCIPGTLLSTVIHGLSSVELGKKSGLVATGLKAVNLTAELSRVPTPT